MHPADNGILDMLQRVCQGRLCPPGKLDRQGWDGQRGAR
jgi:hypothetical protein